MSGLETFQEVTTVEDADLLHLKRGTGLNTDKKISGANAKKAVGKSKTISIESPTNIEDISYFFTNKAITISELRAVLTGSGSVTWTVRHGTDRSGAGLEVVTGGTVTTDTTVGSDVTTFDDATIVADSHVWIETTAKSGTVDSIIITLFYDED
jgi:hypothetical protein